MSKTAGSSRPRSATTGRKPTSKDGWALPVHQARSRDQRDRLLKAGERVFATRGFWESHVDDITRLADCSVGSFYRRFKDKEALFFALQDDMAEKSSAHIEQFFTSPLSLTRPLTSVCFHLIENSAVEAMKISGYYRALFEMSLRGRQVWNQMRRLEMQLAENFVTLLEKRGMKVRPAGELVPAIAYAMRMINGVELSVMLHGPGPFDIRDPDAFALLTRMLMQILDVPVDEAELEKLVAKRRPARAAASANTRKTARQARAG
jgi:AcrR family transcriptional regulator